MPTDRIVLPKIDENGPIDYLDEDPEIPTQRYCVISFLSPEKVIKHKDQFFFEKFVRFIDHDWKIKGIESLMAFLAKKYSLKVEDLMKDGTEFAKVRSAEMKETDIFEQYNVFLLKHEKSLQEEYDNLVEFRTNTRGVKVRRAFANAEEAQTFAKVCQRRYPKDSIYVGKVGAWLPWDPSEHMIQDVQYANDQLNELMRKYQENESNRELFFAEERENAMKSQKEENEKRRKASAMQKALEDSSAPTHPTEGVIRE
jgi:hypothetical protein